MSYYYEAKHNLKLLRRINEFRFINELYIEPEGNREVIEVGHWVKQLLD